MTAAPRRRPQLISVEEAATILGVSKMSVYRRLQAGLLVGYRMGRNIIRVDADSVDRYLAGARIVPGREEW